MIGNKVIIFYLHLSTLFYCIQTLSGLRVCRNY